MQPLTIVALLGFYALVSWFAFVASTMWTAHNPLLWGFMVSGAVALALMAREVFRRFTIGRTEFFLTFAIALIATEAIQWWW